MKMKKKEIIKELDILTEKVRHAQERMDVVQKENEYLKSLVNQLASRIPHPTPTWVQHSPVPLPKGCSTCGLGADGKVYGYVCNRTDCPTKVTC
jgi:hypothetical protein